MKAELLLLLALGACKEEATQEVPDAGSTPRAFGARELGVFVTLPMGWAEDSVDDGPSGAQNGSPSVMTKEVRTVARAHRVSTGKTFLVPPKLVVTVEPTARKNPQEVFEQTLADLKKLDGAADVGVVRSAMSSRFVGREQVGEIEIAYFVRAGNVAREVIHRSLLVLRRPPEGSRAIVTVTATYLAQDQETVSAELQAIMSSLRLEGAMAVE